MPPNPRRDATAIVRQVRVVNQIWTIPTRRYTSYEGGEGIRRPFQMVDLEFTPEGASDSIHALDRIDLGSVPGLREGGTVRIAYALSDPHAVRIAGATSTYARAALLYLLGLTYGIGAVMALVVIPVFAWGKGLLNRFWRLAAKIPADEVKQQLLHLPADDPRRKALETFIRSQHDQQAPNIEPKHTTETRRSRI